MMEVSVRWRRVIQIQPYETETIELGVTETIDPGAPARGLGDVEDHAQLMAKAQEALYREIKVLGDELLLGVESTQPAAAPADLPARGPLRPQEVPKAAPSPAPGDGGVEVPF